MWRSADASRSIPWRDSILPLKQEHRIHGVLSSTSVISAIDFLLSQPNTTAIKDQEVSEDLSFLAQQLQSQSSSGRAQVLYCRLVASVLQGRRLVIHTAAASIICNALRGWADSRDEEEDGSGDRQVQVEALLALAVFLQDNLGSVVDHEQAAVLALIFTLIQGTELSTPSRRKNQLTDSRPNEAQRLAILALASCYQGSRPHNQSVPSCHLSPGHTMTALSCMVHVLTVTTSGGAAVQEDNLHSRHIAAIIRTLSAVLVESRGTWVHHTAPLVEGFRCLMQYGTASTGMENTLKIQVPAKMLNVPEERCLAAAMSVPSAASGRSRYLPPHMRAKAVQSTGESSGSEISTTSTSEALISSSTAVTSSWTHSHMSGARRSSSSAEVVPTSAEEGSSAADRHATLGSAASLDDRFKSSKVRLGVLQCLQTMAKSDSRALHPHWTSLLPTHQPLLPRPAAVHLITMLLYDPIPKVRSMAATTISCLLEGPPQRAYLAVAEAKDLSAATSHNQQRAAAAASLRGFTTLSATLGQMVVATHKGLLHAVASEAVSGVKQISLRALCVLMSGSPYHRLPTGVLPDAFKGVLYCWQQQRTGSQSSGTASPATPGTSVQQYNTSSSRPRPSPVVSFHEMAALESFGAASSESLAVQVACLACLAEAVLTKQPVPGLAEYFRQQKQQQQAGSTTVSLCREVPHDHTPLDLVLELLECCRSRHAMLRVESMAILRGLAANYPMILVSASTSHLPPESQAEVDLSLRLCCWNAVFEVVQFSMDCSTAPLSPMASPRRPTSVSDNNFANSSASTSPEDKAAQHAVQLLGACLGAEAAWLGIHVSEEGLLAEVSEQESFTSEGVDEGCKERDPGFRSALSGLREQWQHALELLMSHGCTSHSYMVRSAALSSVIMLLPQEVADILPPSTRQGLISVIVQLADKDAAAAVRSVAIRTLGMLGSHAWMLLQTSRSESRPAEDAQALHDDWWCALRRAQIDSVISVRISASWAVANICEAAARHYARVHLQLQLHGSTDVAAGGTLSPGSLSWQLLELLMDTALQASRDMDKVRSHGVRALGALLSFLHLCAGGRDAMLPVSEEARNTWVEAALSCLQSCLTTGNMRVQCEAASSAQRCLSRLHFIQGGGGEDVEVKGRTAAMLQARLVPLLLLLVMLVRDNSNLKIRTHAAEALAALGTKWIYGDVYHDALLVVCNALESQDGSLPNDIALNAGSTASAEVSEVEVAPVCEMPNRSEGRFPNYRYAQGLSRQLSKTLIHLLSLAEASDSLRLKEGLSKRAEVLKRTLHSAAQACVTSSPLWETAASASCHTPESALPVDPFDVKGVVPAAMHSLSHTAGFQSDAGGGSEGWSLSDGLDRALKAVQQLELEGGLNTLSNSFQLEYGSHKKLTDGKSQVSLKFVIKAMRGLSSVLQGSQIAPKLAGPALQDLLKFLALSTSFDEWASIESKLCL
ncbi:hypothetical protein CEUSTIGMA_g2901.t1 [Chlamydomonas eustigma]|uniref:DUF4042 domain-containing protein n=1 Tax=Chlamydomonas eustigma TaxID=1157962 RepID=A0A250WX88_9CHLO|nr:hypothetical protein CEUSTIGMA_g2901.t1 [Chlamydomonas eustigma]|eukprot:GAX75458.1 hypothetical protein CEUSTIGMA_g2901.t1 [Chlamydomonas eustigma]